MVKKRIIFICLGLVLGNSFSLAAEISFTMDDPQINASALFSPWKRNEEILAAFDQFKVKGALFVCGMRIDNVLGKALLKRWDTQGHLIANHSYSHLSFNSKQISFETFRDDFLKVEPLLQKLRNFTRLFRFPYLKEGETENKRDEMRLELKKRKYQQGYVSIDASDWYIDSRLKARLAKDPHADVRPYRDFYLKHIWDRATYYDDLAKKVFGKTIKHTLLVHHNDLNALFLVDLMQMFKDKGWSLISAKDAYTDPVFDLEPDIVPAGESIVWSAAKETGKFENILRYPGEDSEYEKDEMDQLGL